MSECTKAFGAPKKTGEKESNDGSKCVCMSFCSRKAAYTWKRETYPLLVGYLDDIARGW